MNITAIRAYSQAAGVRPSLPARNKSAVTDGFDVEIKPRPQAENAKYEAAATKQGQNNAPRKEEQTERFALFTKSAQVATFAMEKGKLFDGRA